MAKRSSKTIALGALPLMAATFLASCGDDEQAYCVDQNDVVTENQYCDDDYHNTTHPYFWAFVGGGSAKKIVKGSKITGANSKIASTNKAALASKGGFGSSSSSSGVGRSVASSHGSSGGG